LGNGRSELRGPQVVVRLELRLELPHENSLLQDQAHLPVEGNRIRGKADRAEVSDLTVDHGCPRVHVGQLCSLVRAAHVHVHPSGRQRRERVVLQLLGLRRAAVYLFRRDETNPHATLDGGHQLAFEREISEQLRVDIERSLRRLVESYSRSAPLTGETIRSLLEMGGVGLNGGGCSPTAAEYAQSFSKRRWSSRQICGSVLVVAKSMYCRKVISSRHAEP